MIGFGLVQRGGGTCGFWRDKERKCVRVGESIGGSLVDGRLEDKEESTYVY
jgi:hypothetical protein